MADWFMCCLRWRYSAFDRNSNRERLLSSPEVQLDTTHMGVCLCYTVLSIAVCSELTGCALQWTATRNAHPSNSAFAEI